MEILLTDDEADRLIALFKSTFTQGTRVISEGTKGTIDIRAVGNPASRFQLQYMNGLNNIHLNFMDNRTKNTLVRINLDTKFHVNSDGKVSGHRVELFSAEEFEKKHDGVTQVKAYPLPYDGLRDCDNFLDALSELLAYTHTQKQNELRFVLAPSLL
ncbi:DUF6978 family protein [Schleiferilactobacillus shenzhenensis]|uniref:DUF6978 family protein n=1 Tax=Schleiferilactobacillus shenzhenensis TaxID=1231337 RepID=UPI00068C89F5|nr:hypothetical protein [Schleiferilactobacillus shenzhenensis]